MDRPLVFASGSAACALLSFATVPLQREETALAHAAQNATWGLVVAAVVLALLATDGIGARKLPKRLLVAGVLAAATRAMVAFAAMLPSDG